MDFNELKNKAKSMIKGHEEQVSGGVDKATGAAKDRFGHGDQVDKVTGVAKGQMGLGEQQKENLGESAQPSAAPQHEQKQEPNQQEPGQPA